MFTDGANKPKGKFLKKGSTLSQKVKIQRYNFAEIRKKEILFPDNPSYNVFYSRLQHPESIAKAVKPAHKILEDLQGPNMRSPIIFPRDFTADWMEENKKLKRRNSQQEFDDDEFEMAIEEEERRLRDEEWEEDNNQTSLSKESIAADPSKTSSDSKIEDEDDPKPQQSPLSIYHDPGTAPEHLKDIQAAATGGSATVEDMNNAIQNLTNPPQGTESDSTQNQKDENVSENTDFKGSQDETQPMQENPSKEDEKSDGLEKAKDQEIYEKGREEGRREAESETADSTVKLNSLLQNGLSQLADMKKSILKKSEDNFKEVSAAISESLIGKALDIDPVLFRGIVEKAIEEGIFEDSFLVKINPTDLKKINDIGGQTLPEQWQSSSDVEQGNFVIESKESKISSGVHEIVRTMVDQLGSDLFDSTSPIENEMKPKIDTDQ